MKSRGYWRALITAALIAAFLAVSVPFVAPSSASAGVVSAQPPQVKADPTFEWLNDYSPPPGAYQPVKTAKYDIDRDGRLEILSGGPRPGTSYIVGARLESDESYTDIGDVSGGYLSGAYLEDFAVDDFNRDGLGDFAVATSGDTYVIFGDGGTDPISWGTVGEEHARAVAAGDFDRDGWTDFVTAGPVDLLFHQNGDGSFDPGTPAYEGAVNARNNGVVTLDYDRDGILDLAISSATEGMSGIYRGLGDGTFLPPIGAPVITEAVTVGDFNGDGWDDVAWYAQDEFGSGIVEDVSTPTGRDYWYIEAPDGGGQLSAGDMNADPLDDLTFEYYGAIWVAVNTTEGPRPSFPINLDVGPRRLPVAGDFNQDSLDEIAVLDGMNIETFINTTDEPHTASFPTSNTVDLADLMSVGDATIGCVDVGDLDRDGAQDVVVGTNGSDPDLVVLFGDGQGGVRGWSRYAIDNGAASVKIADMDLDGDLDVVLEDQPNAEVWLNNGKGYLSEEWADQRVGLWPAYIDVGDINQDGWPDIALGNSPGETSDTGAWYSGGEDLDLSFESTYSAGWGSVGARLGYVKDDRAEPVLTFVPQYLTALVGTVPDAPDLTVYDTWNMEAEYVEDSSYHNPLSFGDLDGNGRDDAVISSGRGTNVVWNTANQFPSGEPTTIYYDGETEHPLSTWADDINRDSYDESIQSVGLDGTGRLDLTTFRTDSPDTTQLPTAPYTLRTPKTGDFNRDGRQDIVAFGADSTQLVFYLSGTAGTLKTDLSLSPSSPNGTNGWYKVRPTVTVKRMAGEALTSGNTYYQLDEDATADSESSTESQFDVTLPSGTHYLSAFSVSGGTTETPPVRTIEVKCDIVPPVATIYGVPEGIIGNQASLTFTAVDNLSGVDRIEYRIADGQVQPYRDHPVIVSQAGDTKVEYRAVDVAGNVGAWREATIHIDPNVAVTTIDGLAEGWVNHYQEFTLDVSSPTTVLWSRYSIDGGTELPYLDTPVRVSGEGTTTIGYHSANEAGTEALHEAQAFIDYTPPTVLTPVSATYDDSALIPITATDALSGVAGCEWSLDWGPPQTSDSAAVTTAGYHTLRITAFDNAGNESVVAERSFTVRTKVALSSPSAGTSHPKRRKDYTYRSTMTPNESGARVYYELQKKSGRTWKPYKTYTASAVRHGGHMDVIKRLPLMSSGSYRLRSRHGDAIHLTSYSAWRSLTVR